MVLLSRHTSHLRYETGLRRRQGTILVTGIMTFASGTIFLCNIAALATTSWSVIGLMLCVTGAMQLFAALQIRQRIGLLALLPVIAFYVLFGTFCLTGPSHRFVYLNLVFFTGLVATGALRICCGCAMRRTNGAGWLVAAGLVTVAIGMVLIARWPENSLSMTGALIAIDLMVYGLGFIAFVLCLNRPPARQ